ncbi:MAG: extracellular solute-binding protein [Spirochaetaceae bacterium]|nr:MAG: extracellular solute-binding protein [Spirochaetaceae bacterium]
MIRVADPIALLLAVFLCVVSFPADAQVTAGLAGRSISYDDYLLLYVSSPRPDASVTIAGADYARTDIPSIVTYDDFHGVPGPVLRTEEEGFVEWEIDVPQAGLYHIRVDYFPVPGRSSEIEREVRINGEVPFDRARYVSFSRVWANGEPIRRDNRDNDLRPGQVETPRWQSAYVRDFMGYYNEPFLFRFEQGVNTLRLTAVKEPMVVGSITVHQAPEIPTYAQLLDRYRAAGYPEYRGEPIKVQGQDADLKSDPMLYPIFDRTSPATEPYHPSKIRLNTIGGYRWVLPGQWLLWKIEIDKPGLYQIALKTRQNITRGLFTNRRLTINGEVPFREVENIAITYNMDWQMTLLGDDEPFLFYFDAGVHELKLEVVLSNLAEILRTAEASVYALNAAYRQFLMITGPTPDPYRDYELDRELPGVMVTLREQSEILKGLSRYMQEYTGQRGPHNATLDRLSIQLDSMIRVPRTIPTRMGAFRANVGALGQWILQTRQQPLEIDYILVTAPGERLPSPDVGPLRRLVHRVRAFIASFTEDYNSIGNVHGDRAIEVWVPTGRDQAQVLKEMIDNTFTPNTGIEVNLKLVQPNVLLAATVAGRGPDVAMQVWNSDPVNYAIRNAVHDMSRFPDFADVATLFHESALTPFRFQDGVFALPEQQWFPMLFYRRDIFEELGIRPPDTWDDLFVILPEIQKNNMDFALPITQLVPGSNPPIVITGNLQTFTMKLFQRDGELYVDGDTRTGLNTDAGIRAFRDWTDLYVNYKLPLQFDMLNRFRTGEIPLAIADYHSLYNPLQVFAPELRGLWGFVPVPALKREDGSLNRAAPSGGTAVMLMEHSRNRDESWEYIKWWVSTESQVRFAREMESLLGPSGRFPTANREAMTQLPWPVRDYRMLEAQWEWVRGIPEVPGGYFTPRHLDNAFRSVVISADDVIETAEDYARVINDEIDLKRREFGLPTWQEG